MRRKRRPAFAPPQTSGLAVSEWENNDFPKLNGKLIKLDQYDGGRALAIAPDASRFVLGTEWRLRAYRADGRRAVAEARSRHRLWRKHRRQWQARRAAYGDGTIRWHRLGDGQELLALFVHAKDRRFIAWTPKGYYAASPGAEDLIAGTSIAAPTRRRTSYPASTFASTITSPPLSKPRWIMLTRRRCYRRRRASSIRCGSGCESVAAMER